MAVLAINRSCWMLGMDLPGSPSRAKGLRRTRPAFRTCGDRGLRCRNCPQEPPLRRRRQPRGRDEGPDPHSAGGGQGPFWFDPLAARLKSCHVESALAPLRTASSRRRWHSTVTRPRVRRTRRGTARKIGHDDVGGTIGYDASGKIRRKFAAAETHSAGQLPGSAEVSSPSRSSRCSRATSASSSKPSSARRS